MRSRSSIAPEFADDERVVNEQGTSRRACRLDLRVSDTSQARSASESARLVCHDSLVVDEEVHVRTRVLDDDLESKHSLLAYTLSQLDEVSRNP